MSRYAPATDAAAQVQSRFQDPVPQPGWPKNTVDLHTHTDRSDGVLPAAELYRAMAEMRPRGGGDQRPRHAQRLPRAARRRSPAGGLSGPQLIPAVEINSIADRELIEMGVELEEGELHILGYGVDVDNADFLAAMERQRDARRVRLMMIIDALQDAG